MSSVSSETVSSMSPESPIGGRKVSSSSKEGILSVPLPQMLVRAKSDAETMKPVESHGAKPSWAKMVARSASKV